MKRFILPLGILSLTTVQALAGDYCSLRDKNVVCHARNNSQKMMVYTTGNGVIVDKIQLAQPGTKKLTFWVTNDRVHPTASGLAEVITAETLNQDAQVSLAWGSRSAAKELIGTLKVVGMADSSLNGIYSVNGCTATSTGLVAQVNDKNLTAIVKQGGSPVQLSSDRLFDSQHPKALENYCN
jgi:hypothetical protein